MTNVGKVFVYCDDASHPGRLVAVTNFARTSAGYWTEVPASRASRDGRVGTGATLVGNTMPEPGWALDPEVSNRDIRERFDLVCRRCPRAAPVVARAETLFPRLDRFASAGVSRVSLSLLAASLQEQVGGA